MPRQNQKPIFRSLIALALPVIGTQVLGIAALVVDTAVCGRLPNPSEQLAALAIAFQVFIVLDFTAVGLSIGAVVLVSRAHGAQDPARVIEIVDQASRILLMWAFLVGVAGNLATEPILRALGARDGVLDAGTTYLRLLFAGVPFSYLALLYMGVFRGLGNTRTPMLCGLVANVLNIVLTYVLVFGKLGLPSLGIAGAALGTVASYIVNLALQYLLLRRQALPQLSLSLFPRRADRTMTRSMFRIGIPAASDMLMLSVHMIAMVGMLGYLNEASVAAHGIGVRVQMTLAIVPSAIQQASAAMIGMALGAGDAARARQIGRVTLLFSMGVMTAIGAIILLTAPQLSAAFDVPEGSVVEEYTVAWIQIIGLSSIPVSVHLARVAAISGAGATGTSFRITVISIAVQIPLAWLLAFPLEVGPYGIWWALMAAYVIRGILADVVYRRGLWARTGVEAAGA